MDGRLGTCVMVAGLGVVLLLGMAAVPLMFKLVVDFQLRIGNGDAPLVRFFDTHRTQIIFGMRAIYLLGLIVALPTMIKDGFFRPRSPGTAKTAAAIEGVPARSPAGAMPPLEYQIRESAVIVLAVTQIQGEVVLFPVLERWKSTGADLPSASDAFVLSPHIEMHKLLGYVPVQGQQVVLFFTRDGWAKNDPVELLPISDGHLTYAPSDASVRRSLTVEAIRELVRRS